MFIRRGGTRFRVARDGTPRKALSPQHWKRRYSSQEEGGKGERISRGLRREALPFKRKSRGALSAGDGRHQIRARERLGTNPTKNIKETGKWQRSGYSTILDRKDDYWRSGVQIGGRGAKKGGEREWGSAKKRKVAIRENSQKTPHSVRHKGGKCITVKREGRELCNGRG